jgi:hypothetical protein
MTLIARRSLVSVAAVALLFATGAPATSGEPTASSTAATATDLSGVTVTGEKTNPLVDTTTQYLRSHLPESQSGQLARFRDEICVSVVGLPPAYDAFVARRITALANEVHAPVAKAANCTANVHVIFSPQPQAQMADITKRRESLLGIHFAAQLRRISTVSRPIQSWYLTGVRDATGERHLEGNVQANMDLADIVHGGGDLGGGAQAGSPDQLHGRPGSRLGNDMSAEVVHALIIADAKKVADARIGAVADYIAMLALARWDRLDRCNPVPSILNLMADGCVQDAPAVATSADLGLLTALYAVNPRESGVQQRADIASHIEAALKRGDRGETR